MISLKYGIGQIFMDKWPIFLGVGIVVIFALMIVFALYKTNSFEIFRFFKNKIDEEERLLRQKRSSRSTMRSFSRQDSRLPVTKDLLRFAQVFSQMIKVKIKIR